MSESRGEQFEEALEETLEEALGEPEELSPSAARRRRREEELRAGLQPLGPDERPAALLVSVVVSAIMGLAVLVGTLTVSDLSSKGGSLAGGVFLTVIFLALAYGMYERRYWAVLGFEGLLAFQVLVTSLALVVASTLPAAGVCLVSVGLGGWLFWKLIRVMGRIQSGERPDRQPNP